MSYTTVYLIHTNGAIKEIAPLENSHGFGPYVWNCFCGELLGNIHAWRDLDLVSDEKLESWARDKNIPRQGRAALLLVENQAVIEHARFIEIMGLLHKFVMDADNGFSVCHFSKIAELLEQHANDADGLGMCFDPSSLSDNLWFEYDEETDKEIPYDVKTGTRHFYVGEVLDKTDGKVVKE